jgi:hypothetical protein
MAAKLTRLTHKIAIQLHLVAESYTICSSRSRWAVRKLLDTPSYCFSFLHAHSTVALNKILSKLKNFALVTWSLKLHHVRNSQRSVMTSTTAIYEQTFKMDYVSPSASGISEAQKFFMPFGQKITIGYNNDLPFDRVLSYVH